jgi:hypothetical protein
MEYSECLPTLLNPLAERACFSQVTDPIGAAVLVYLLSLVAILRRDLCCPTNTEVLDTAEVAALVDAHAGVGAGAQWAQYSPRVQGALAALDADLHVPTLEVGPPVCTPSVRAECCVCRHGASPCYTPTAETEGCAVQVVSLEDEEEVRDPEGTRPRAITMRECTHTLNELGYFPTEEWLQSNWQSRDPKERYIDVGEMARLEGLLRASFPSLERGEALDTVRPARGEPAITSPSPLNVLKDTSDHSCY